MNSDPCTPKGHECDGCLSCRKGKCCRKDNPSYRLPELGEIKPFFGTLGWLTDDGERAECHVCGGWYGHLGAHVSRAHDLLPEEYKSAFGLNQGTGLIGPKTRGLRQLNTDHLRPYNDLGKQALASMTKEQRTANSQGRRSLEAKARYAAAAERNRRIETHQCEICGKSFIASGHDQNERRTCGRRECWRAVQRLRGLKKVTCVICGTSWTQTSSVVRKTCSDECDAERRRRFTVQNGVSKRPDVRKRISEAASKRRLVRNDKGQIVTWDRN